MLIEIHHSDIVPESAINYILARSHKSGKLSRFICYRNNRNIYLPSFDGHSLIARVCVIDIGFWGLNKY